MQSITGLLNHYGYIVLLVALMLELIAFPLPGEVLMTYCGFLINQQKLNWLLSIIVASFGTIIGITISYFVGSKLGVTFFKRYGHYIHLGPEKLDKTSVWFNKYGNRLLVISYFIPGVRHITGYFSGITEISYRKFALNSYIGAILWTATFISLGKVLGNNWERYHSMIKKYLIIGSLIISLIIIVAYLYKNYNQKIIEFTIRILRNAVKTFHSFGRLKIGIAGVSASFLGFFVLVIGVTQDFLAHEFNQFDIIVTYLVKTIFTENWRYMMDLFDSVTSLKILIPLTVFIIILIMVRGIDKFLEIRFMFLVIWGGEVLEVILRLIFRHLGPTGLSLIETIKYTFPSKQSFMTIVAYGFLCFLILRHTKKNWIGTASVVITIIICFLGGLSPLFYQIQYPSDVYAGYVFGGVWLTLNIILLEVYRILPRIQQ
ncbi:VTT domain-containing protein [Clostridium magnum]|uniref:Inner membrane protein YghB n=1 Tax=Clostridium magnum DSM 2767 TaxID=1121326 RepID=A0A161WXK0_9CLOT|nr:VTT domain-containing protein [Clostridium magnum]KZL91728.1 inner membrane protein YghB [Clostridium magnum DSM 2767]SHJ04064.1 membrane protein DedA, SNARE-associated domain [Clostridium magnum DSM 2767]